MAKPQIVIVLYKIKTYRSTYKIVHMSKSHRYVGTYLLSLDNIVAVLT